MPAYNSGSTRQLRSRKGQLASDAPHRLPTVSIGMASQTRDIIIMSEGIITDRPSPATDVDAAMVDEMAAGSRREDTAPALASVMDDTAPTGDFAPSSEDAAPASIIEETIPGGIRSSTPIDGPTGHLSEDATEAAASASIIEETITGGIETSIRDEASTHVNIVGPASGKATVDEDSAVAMDEDAPIPVEKRDSEEVRVVSVSTGNVDHDTIIVEEEEVARFELDEEGPQVEMPQSPAAGGSMQTILIEDSDDEQIADVGGSTQPIVVDESDGEQIDEVPEYIRDIVGRNVSDMESEYSDDSSNSGSPRQFSRSSRLQGRLNQLQDNHVGYTIKVLERLIEQIESRDDGEPDNTDRQGHSMDVYLLSEMNATSRTIGSLDWIIKDIQKYRTKLSRARRHQKKQRAARRV
ncbi:hypothetical protein BKA64DRAFT_714895 [Cadophora sp. MPI-SDFR-AT-0126]|nr:hypothetical protein BKA64DRAFT_714895 [Leotiomycetes sp. MPI-SDFR-AT-0126]